MLSEFMRSSRILRFAQEALLVELKNNALELNQSTIEKSTSSSNNTFPQQNLSVEALMTSLPVRVEPQGGAAPAPEMSEASLKQLKKDIERDALVINGRMMVGSELKLEGCFARICEAVESVLVECGLPLLGPEAMRLLAFHVLNRISRTHSGGLSFQTLRSIVDTESTLIVPNSAAAPPLRIVISAGSFPSPHTRVQDDEAALNMTESAAWGLRCHVSATTSFSLKSIAHLDAEVDASSTDLSVRVVFEDSISLQIDPRMKEVGREAVDKAVSSSLGKAVVTIMEDESQPSPNQLGPAL